MKRIEYEHLPQEMASLMVACQREKVVIAREGKPYALIVGVEFKDQEDLQLETSPAFWAMIRERRAETRTISLEDVVAELQAEENAPGNGSAETAAKQPAP